MAAPVQCDGGALGSSWPKTSGPRAGNVAPDDAACSIIPALIHERDEARDTLVRFVIRGCRGTMGEDIGMTWLDPTQLLGGPHMNAGGRSPPHAARLVPACSLASRLFRCVSLSRQNWVKLSARNDIEARVR